MVLDSQRFLFSEVKGALPATNFPNGVYPHIIKPYWYAVTPDDAWFKVLGEKISRYVAWFTF